MSLTSPEQTTVRTIITREGGVGPACALIHGMDVSDKVVASAASLASLVTVTVSNWTTADAAINALPPAAVLGILTDIASAWAAHDATTLGPLLFQLYGAVVNHFNA